MFNRREFIKSVAAGLLLPPALSSPRLWAMPVVDQKSYLGRSLQQAFELTTLHKTVSAKASLAARILMGPAAPAIAPGELPTVRNELAGHGRGALSKDGRTLLFFSQLTDAHIVDEESPCRVVAAEPYLELIGVRSGFRPHEDLTLQVLESMIRTLNAVAQRSPLDFLLNTGDNIDNAHEIEQQWFLRALEGGGLDPDSGTDQDPLVGPGNDANDLVTATGLLKTIACYGAVGNHDVLFQGNVPIALREIYNSIVKKYLEIMVMYDPVGNYSNAVITPGTTPPDPSELKPGEIVPDARRRGMNGKDFIKSHFAAATSRPFLGFPKNLVGQEFGYYAVNPKSGVPIKMIVLDTTFRAGSATGAIGTKQYNEFLLPELEKAKQNNELVMVVSHHPSDSLLMPSTFEEDMVQQFGRNETVAKMIRELVGEMRIDQDYVSRTDLKETLKSYPNVFLHVDGHTHNNKVTMVGEEGHGYWEVTTASLLDYPQQTRLFEVVYEGNGTAAIQTCVVDHNSAPESLAAKSRELAYQDSQGKGVTAVDFPYPATGSYEDRNAILRFQVPPEVAKRL